MTGGLLGGLLSYPCGCWVHGGIRGSYGIRVLRGVSMSDGYRAEVA